MRRDPRCFGLEGTRWTLAKIHAVCDWLRTTTPAGLSRLLDRLGVSWKRAREHVHSPDPDYLAKLARIAVLVERRRGGDRRTATLYLDELTFYRQPTLARAYEEQGRAVQPLAERSHRANTSTRIIATLDVYDGRVVYARWSKISIPRLVAFYQKLVAAYPEVERIYLVMDNSPVHFHPDLLAALEPQENPYPWYRPANWPTKPRREAVKRWGELRLPIQALPLPTYASWANPIEKLWRKLKQEYLHLHPFADRLEELRQGVDQFLDQFAQGSLDLLRYVGLATRLLVPY